MRRYIFYLAAALAAFVIGSFIALFCYRAAGENKINQHTEVEAKHFYVTEPAFYQTARIETSEKKPPPVCTDKKLLPLWDELRKNQEYLERTDGNYQDIDCAEMIEAEIGDLNDDGRKEFVVWGKPGSVLCGGTGNCALWIYARKNGRYTLLLQAVAFSEVTKWFEIKKTKSKGYRDLLLKSHHTAAETTYEFYKFNGAKYVENRCLMERYYSYVKTSSLTPCKEYFEMDQNSDEWTAFDALRPTIKKWLRGARIESGVSDVPDEAIKGIIGKSRAELTDEDVRRLEAFRFEPILTDFDGDGKNELAVKNNCAPVGNCQLWIFKKDGDFYRILLKTLAGAVQTFDLKAAKTNGYFDLETKDHGTASSGEIVVYKFDGHQYLARECSDYEYSYLKDGKLYELKQPKIIRRQCE